MSRQRHHSLVVDLQTAEGILSGRVTATLLPVPLSQRTAAEIYGFTPFQPGDLLAVREPWCAELGDEGDVVGVWAYRAGCEDPEDYTPWFDLFQGEFSGVSGGTGWLSGARMSASQARFTIKVMEARVVHPSNISARAMQAVLGEPQPLPLETLRTALIEVWEATYPRKWGSWGYPPMWFVRWQLVGVRSW